MDVKKWFEEGTGLKIRELRYLAPPSLPYNIFIDTQITRGADYINNLIEHNITFEHYSDHLNDEDEKKISNFLNSEAKKFEKNSDWLNEEKMYITTFELDPFLEKVRKEKKNG